MIVFVYLRWNLSSKSSLISLELQHSAWCWILWFIKAVLLGSRAWLDSQVSHVMLLFIYLSILFCLSLSSFCALLLSSYFSLDLLLHLQSLTWSLHSLLSVSVQNVALVFMKLHFFLPPSSPPLPSTPPPRFSLQLVRLALTSRPVLPSLRMSVNLKACSLLHHHSYFHSLIKNIEWYCLWT